MTQQHTHTTRRSAFTIVEMLVVIGILVIVAVGVATIFGSVGETVARGRKLSELNQFAARIERVMREDFENMTRDGFLVIVNKNANFGQDVQLYRGEQTNVDADLYPGYSDDFGRIRRSDEIMFFARGNYETGRRAVASNMRASSNEAAIYYGHGQKRAPDLTDYTANNNYFFNPQPWDTNFSNSIDARLGVNNLGFVNPNEFARDWSLLRQVTLMTNPQGAGQRVPKELYGISSDLPLQRPLLQDSARQIALQPAARSIFKSLSGSARVDSSGNLINRSLYDIVLAGMPQSAGIYPLNLRTSGVVDIVTQDLATMRSELQSIAPTTTQSPSFYMSSLNTFTRPPTTAPVGGTRTREDFVQRYYNTPTLAPNPGDYYMLNLGKQKSNGRWMSGNTAQQRNIRQWMIDALPSAWNLDHTRANLFATDFLGGVRYEDIPTRVLYNESDFPNTDQGSLQRVFAEANQEMLGASVFVPRCTEFVVEWSYGFVNNQAAEGNPQFKQLIWYGLDRFVDSDGDGLIEPGEARAAITYRQRSTGAAGTDPSTTPAINRQIGPEPSLVVGRELGIAGIAPPDLVEIACFGFSTVPAGQSGGSGMPNAVAEGAYWPWPKLVRITMSLGDPSDRDVEATYQVIFELPRPE